MCKIKDLVTGSTAPPRLLKDTLKIVKGTFSLSSSLTLKIILSCYNCKLYINCYESAYNIRWHTVVQNIKGSLSLLLLENWEEYRQHPRSQQCAGEAFDKICEILNERTG